nr:MAG TPA: hypothetical protein [Caudoviricetes sp.]
MCIARPHQRNLSVVSLGDAVRLLIPLGRYCRARGSRLKGKRYE